MCLNLWLLALKSRNDQSLTALAMRVRSQETSCFGHGPVQQHAYDLMHSHSNSRLHRQGAKCACHLEGFVG